MLSTSAQLSWGASDLPPEVGYNYGDLEMPRTLALGGAGRATSHSTSALFVNPANVALSPVYHVGAFAEIWPEAERFTYGAAAVDSIVNKNGVAGAISGATTRQDKNGIDRQYNDVRFALALPIQQTFFLGVAGHLLWLSQDGEGPLGTSRASSGLSGERIVDGFTFDVGATVKPHKDVGVSLVGTNLTNPDTGFQPLTVGAGVGYAPTDLSVEVDAVADFTTWGRTTYRAMAGGELLVGEAVPLRLGYRYDTGAESHAVSAGIGYVQPTFGANASLRRVVGGDAATAVVFGFTIHLEATGLTPTPAQTF